MASEQMLVVGRVRQTLVKKKRRATELLGHLSDDSHGRTLGVVLP